MFYLIDVDCYQWNAVAWAEWLGNLSSISLDHSKHFKLKVKEYQTIMSHSQSGFLIQLVVCLKQSKASERNGGNFDEKKV